jgi:hypothetical protein
MLTPAERTFRARLAAFTLHAKVDPKVTTAKARAGLWLKYLNEVDPNRELPERERLRRAESLRSAHMAKLALKSATARRKAHVEPGA